MAIADNSKPVKKSGQEIETERNAFNADERNWEYVEVQAKDLFGDENNGVSINFIKYGPGRHFVNPEIAREIRRLIAQKLTAEMRIMQPGQDEKMRAMMKNSQLGPGDRM